VRAGPVERERKIETINKKLKNKERNKKIKK
jgi:hypothetical protein